MTCRILTRDEHFQAPGPKRILALDGGGWYFDCDRLLDALKHTSTDKPAFVPRPARPLIAVGAGTIALTALIAGYVLRPKTQHVIQSLLVSVKGNETWQPTNVRVESGDYVEIAYVSGQWSGARDATRINPADVVPVADVAASSCFPVPENRAGPLGSVAVRVEQRR